MILFAGDVSEGYFLEECVQEEVKYTGKITAVSEVTKPALEMKYSLIAVEVSQFLNPAPVIAAELLKIKSTCNTPVLIVAPGFRPKSDVIALLLKNGFQNFVFSSVLSLQKEEVVKIQNGIPSFESTGEGTELPDAEPLKLMKKPISLERGGRHIALCGSMGRIGTTTQALQLIKYLLFKGYKACYLEMNHTGFVKALQSTYNIKEGVDAALGCVTYNGIDLYFRQERICDILKMDYDFFVSDFGAMTESDFHMAGFLEKETRIVVCGAFPNEYHHATAAMASLLGNDGISFIFSFCSTEEARDILEQMGEKALSTIFAEYAPDPFVLLGKGIQKYDALLRLENKKHTEKRKTGSFLFKKRQVQHG